jgi:hypothetical protein
MENKDILAEEKAKERARRQEQKQKEIDYHAQYKKPKKVETYQRTIHGSTGVKVKTIERRTYANGVVKEKLIKVEKDQGMGNMKRIF